MGDVLVLDGEVLPYGSAAARGRGVLVVHDFEVPALALLRKGDGIVATFNNSAIEFQVVRRR